MNFNEKPTRAFPGSGSGHLGMTLRDYFASQIAQGLATESTYRLAPTALAKIAYEIADHMLAVRQGQELQSNPH